uniref:C1orf31 n=1 Tax=Lepeophtheirus salmonis TaxID=72036 RepID=C1BUU7_LEPSM|nr:C1orf31 [Lepeophtheirus salmonis]
MADTELKTEKFLKKAERKACWESRDTHWDCLKSNKEDERLCISTRKAFATLCPDAWVKHFDRKYQVMKFKETLIKEGADKMDAEVTQNPENQKY